MPRGRRDDSDSEGKANGKPEKMGTEMYPGKVTKKANMVEIVNLPNPAQYVRGARKASILLQARWHPQPQRYGPLSYAFIPL